MSGNHDTGGISIKISVPTHNETDNFHDIDYAIVVPKATSLPEVIVKPDGQNNTNVGHNNVEYTKQFTYDGKTDISCFYCQKVWHLAKEYKGKRDL